MVYLEGATTFLDAMLATGSVLVRCEQGMSRSATILMAYLMRFHGMTRNEAYVACKTKRPIVNPNEGFWKQLEAYKIILQTAPKKSTNSKMAAIAIDEES